MINICNILPSNCIDENMPRQKYEMYLTHKILEDPSKYEFLAHDTVNRISSYKILDNSACELGKGLDIKDVLEAARIISADEIVLPDLPRKGNSLSYTLKYLLQVPEDMPYKLAGVIQGETEEEIISCAEQLAAIVRVDTLMLPKWYCQIESTNGLGRLRLVSQIRAIQKYYKMQLDIPEKPIHFLGMDTGLREIIHPVVCRVVRSIDTGYFAALSTPQWKHLDVMAERPRELKIDLGNMDVDMDRWKKLVEDQQKILNMVEGEKNEKN